MSDKPLFQNADEQEAAYAPDQLALGTTGAWKAGQEEGGETGVPGDGVVVPGAAAGPIGGHALSGNLGTTGTMGSVPAPGPVVAGAQLDEGQDRDDDGVVEGTETQQPQTGAVRSRPSEERWK